MVRFECPCIPAAHVRKVLHVRKTEDLQHHVESKNHKICMCLRLGGKVCPFYRQAHSSKSRGFCLLVWEKALLACAPGPDHPVAVPLPLCCASGEAVLHRKRQRRAPELNAGGPGAAPPGPVAAVAAPPPALWAGVFNAAPAPLSVVPAAVPDLGHPSSLVTDGVVADVDAPAATSDDPGPHPASPVAVEPPAVDAGHGMDTSVVGAGVPAASDCPLSAGALAPCQEAGVGSEDAQAGGSSTGSRGLGTGGSHPDLAALQQFLEQTFDPADQLVVVSKDAVRCQLCNSARPVGATLGSASDVTLIRRSATKGGTFNEAIRRHVAGQTHQEHRRRPTGPRQTSLLTMFSKGPAPVPVPAPTTACCGYQGTSVTYTHDGKQVELDPMVLVNDCHDGINADGSMVWYADSHRKCFWSR